MGVRGRRNSKIGSCFQRNSKLELVVEDIVKWEHVSSDQVNGDGAWYKKVKWNLC